MNPNESSSFAENGFVILANILSPEKCDALAKDLSTIYEREQQSGSGKIGGIRNLLRQSPPVFELASSTELKNVLAEQLGEPVFPVRALFFDKTPDANWRVPWHQDLTIAVEEKAEVSGFNAWSIKEGVLHVQPPREILESMATIRIHLDDCDLNNGALKVIPRSHSCAKLNASEIADWTKKTVVICEMLKGSALLMRPLLLHSSSPAKSPSHRRVLHLEYATRNLMGGLKWFDAR